MHYIEKNISHQKLHKPDNSGMTILKQLKTEKKKSWEFYSQWKYLLKRKSRLFQENKNREANAYYIKGERKYFRLKEISYQTK